MRILEPNSVIFTDPHFHHKKLVELGHRPEGYELLIAESWKAIPIDATVYCLGDVCLGDKVKVHATYIEPMPGYKILIRGNHDREKDSWYLWHGWNEIHDELMLSADVKGRYTRILLTHAPVEDNGKFDINLFGHFHNDLHRLPQFVDIIGPKHRLLALECVDYKLVCFQDLLDGKIEQKNLPEIYKKA